MKVKIFDCDHEKDLEKEINNFLENTKDIEVVDIKYSTSFGRDSYANDIYIFSALIMYRHELVMTIAEVEAKSEILEKYFNDLAEVHRSYLKEKLK